VGEHHQGNGSQGEHGGEFDPFLLRDDPAFLLVCLIWAQMPEENVSPRETNDQATYFIIRNTVLFLPR
jgi:hypothetical protein